MHHSTLAEYNHANITRSLASCPVSASDRISRVSCSAPSEPNIATLRRWISRKVGWRDKVAILKSTSAIAVARCVFSRLEPYERNVVGAACTSRFSPDACGAVTAAPQHGTACCAPSYAPSCAAYASAWFVGAAEGKMNDERDMPRQRFCRLCIRRQTLGGGKSMAIHPTPTTATITVPKTRA